MALRIDINLRELYERLSPECRKQLLQYIKEKLDEAMLERLILSQGGGGGGNG